MAKYEWHGENCESFIAHLFNTFLLTSAESAKVAQPEGPKSWANIASSQAQTQHQPQQQEKPQRPHQEKQLSQKQQEKPEQHSQHEKPARDQHRPEVFIRS